MAYSTIHKHQHSSVFFYLLALLCSLFFSFSAPVQAQRELRLYDIEVLVFRHAGPSTLLPQAMVDYTETPIPLRHPSQDEEDYLLPTHGMETAWRKINNSGAYEAIAFRRWRQAASSYNRPKRYRVHSDQVIAYTPFTDDFFEDPFADLEQQTLEPEAEAEVDESTEVLETEPLIFDLEEAFKVPFPPTETNESDFVLDGWLSFSRQRFYHIGLELELRSIDAWNDSGAGIRSDDRIAQSRRIEVGRFEYFDTPGLSVLVRVLEVEPPDFEALRQEQFSQPGFNENAGFQNQ